MIVFIVAVQLTILLVFKLYFFQGATVVANETTGTAEEESISPDSAQDDSVEDSGLDRLLRLLL